MHMPTAIVCTAANDAYFSLLAGMIKSLKAGPFSATLPIGVIDIGLTQPQRDWLAAQGATVAEARWDLDFPRRDQAPLYFRALSSRPYLPSYFPGYDVMLQLDADAWVQDDSGLAAYIRAAAGGKMVLVPEVDRGYWTLYKPPKFWGQNQKAFAWCFGLGAGHRLGRNPILNTGIFALRADAPHWALWAETHRQVLNRRRLRRTDFKGSWFFLSEQTSMNYVLFGLKQPFTLLPATHNWFCGKGTPSWDAERSMLVEPHAPHQPLAIIHLAGQGAKERVWELPSLQGGTVSTHLTFEAVAEMRAKAPAGA